jgi:predicted nucleic acid-binding Zn ribbon protein
VARPLITFDALTCVECGKCFAWAGPHSRHPARCPACTTAREAGQRRARDAARKDAPRRTEGDKATLTCADCKEPFVWIVRRGNTPQRCDTCSHTRLLARSREYLKAQRDAARAALPQTTCVICNSEIQTNYKRQITCSTECREIRAKQNLIARKRRGRREGAAWYENERERTRHKYQTDDAFREAENARTLAYMKERYASDDEYRQRIRQTDRAKRAAGAYADREREYYRRRYDSDPTFREKFWEASHRRRARRYKVFKTATVRVGPVDGLNCDLCGSSAEAWDHIVPIYVGGPHIDANLRPICRSCNAKRPKQGTDVSEGEAGRVLLALLGVAETDRDESWELSAIACKLLVEGELPPPILIPSHKK